MRSISSQYFVDNEVIVVWIDGAGTHFEVNGEYFGCGQLFILIRQELENNNHLYKYKNIVRDPQSSKNKILLKPLKGTKTYIEDAVATDLQTIKSCNTRIAKNKTLLLKLKPTGE